jgi:hypothetical protein
VTTHIVCRDCPFEALEDDPDEADRIINTHEDETGHDVDDGPVEDGVELGGDSEYVDPLEAVEGETEVEIACPIGEGPPGGCTGWSETVELDEPAEYSDGTITLPGFDWECPDCGNPHEFEVDGIRVSNLV